MGAILPPDPVLLLFAVFSRHDAAFAWAERRVVERFGPLAAKSAAFAFVETDYYDESMGTGLRKQFWAIQQPFDPGELAELKIETNAWEQEYAASGTHDEPRPLNIDPGYLTLGKLVLASTKDHAHRIYLRQGVYAEITLYYQHKQWHATPWTFPDYQRADYQRFFSECRDTIRQRRTEFQR
ncbi:MAG: DUF4416 family protein [Pirellulales bacterium]